MLKIDESDWTRAEDRILKQRPYIFLWYKMLESCELTESTEDSNISYSDAQLNANCVLGLSENWFSCKPIFTSNSCSYSFLARNTEIIKFYLKLNCLQSYRKVFQFSYRVGKYTENAA